MGARAVRTNGEANQLTAATERAAWIVVVTKPMAEKTTKAAIEARGLEVYLPMKLGRHRCGGTIGLPLFPRYLFVKITRATQAWQALFTTQGVTRVLCSEQRPVGVREAFIARVRQVELDGLSALGAEEARTFKPGQAVVTLDGLVRGIFQEQVDDRRAAILVSLLGGADSRLATVDLRKLAHPQSAEE